MAPPGSKLFRRILTIAALAGLAAACTPPPSVPPTAPPASSQPQDLRRLQAAVDKQEQTIQSLSSQIAELDNRLQLQAEALEQLRQASRQTEAAARPELTTPVTGGVAAALPGDGSPTEIFLQAFGDYASGRYQAAVRGFATFLKRFPNNSYASNAQFWLGDCYFNQQQYPQSIQEFERVLKDYPDAPKSPDALLKIAIAQLQLGATSEARQAVETLSRRYPKNPATQKAQELAIP
jgi:tol-pal system protein YbgF